MTSFSLKIIAVISMIISHVTSFLFIPDVMQELWNIPMEITDPIYDGIGHLGVIAFPIFAFFISEGCKHTRNIDNYIGRLFVFALVSELPYQWMTREISLHAETSNIFFTLGLGAFCCKLYRKYMDCDKPIFAIGSILLLSCAAEIWGTDYGFFGVLMIVLPFVISNRKYACLGMGAILTIIYMIEIGWDGSVFGWMRNPYYIVQWLVSLLSLILIACYNNTRGKQSKWFFYWFYPIHAIIISLIKVGFTAILSP